MKEHEYNSKGDGFKNWNSFNDLKKIWPRELQQVLVRTVNNEIFVMIHHIDLTGI